MTTPRPPGLPFVHLNLRRNPFGQPPLDVRGRLAIIDQMDLDELEQKLIQAPFIVQVMGECGRGKSTHMRALHARFPGAPYIYLPHERPRPKVPLTGHRVVFVDETQRLSWWTRRKLWRSGMGVVVGTHQDHRSEFQRARTPFHAVIISGLTRARLSAILARRLEWARRDDGPIPWFTDDAIAGLLELHGDDLRAIEHLCYELVQRMQEVGPVTWPPSPDTPDIPASRHNHEGGVRTITTFAKPKQIIPLPEP